ncbi:PREDICTED: polycystin-1-like [Bison bison bison]|uniref:Polycystin-1-like n=1 Tax=Bison bison bison TaxID=43346 RepID=A0A6P3IHW7_BISBB|nr:PREDICTED: polycystin-1-like [Bison bison bison]
MQRMRGLCVSAVPPVLAPNATLALAAHVLVDSAVEVAFLWTFGDGQQAVGQFKPPYDSFEVPDPTVAQVLVEHNTSHTYTFPGKGCLPPSRPVAWARSALGQRLPGGLSLGPASRMQPG